MTEPELIAEALEGVREYCEEDPVDIVRINGRLAIQAHNECRNNVTQVDLLDTIEWVRINRPELLPDRMTSHELTERIASVLKKQNERQ